MFIKHNTDYTMCMTQGYCIVQLSGELIKIFNLVEDDDDDDD